MNGENNVVEKWVNLDDRAKHLSVSKDTIRARIKAKKIPYYKAGKQYKFKISEIDDYVRNGKITE